MTSNINNTVATTTVNTDGEITLSVNGQELTLSADQVTSVTTALLAGRKASYSVGRKARQAATAKAKAERAAKKVARDKATTARKAAQLKKLRARLARLEKAAA